MPLLHLFFPENDLALAQNISNYTPPPAAAILRRSGEALPLWYANAGDAFMATGINAQWLQNTRNTFGIDVNVWHNDISNYEPAPWGWSRAARQVFISRGFPTDRLPDDEALDRIRELSHRRTAIAVSACLNNDINNLQRGDKNGQPASPACLTTDINSILPPAKELTGEAEIRTFVDAHPHSLFKLPWSSSGRGLVAVDPSTIDKQISQLLGMIRRQGSIIAEEQYQRSVDFACLFHSCGDAVKFVGYSLFTTTGIGSYTSNILLPQQTIYEKITSTLKTPEVLKTVQTQLESILHNVIGNSYIGPLGVDMFTTTDGRLAPVVEINLRRTMGHLALSFAEKYLNAPEAKFSIQPTYPQTTTPEIINGKLRHGTLTLNPFSKLAFTIECQNTHI